MTEQGKKTDFGFQQVPWEEKEQRVGAVFNSVAKNYDLMNDCMSLGLHRLWKRYATFLLDVKPGHQVLDLAGGSGDLSRLLSRKIGAKGLLALADINQHMLEVAQNRLLDEGLFENIQLVQANAESLPFQNNSFDRLIIGFGLRNVRDKEKALKSMYAVLKPGGKLGILEFSSPALPGLKPLYDWYSFHVLPKLGQWIADDSASYNYLAESIRMHPNQEGLKELVERAGFEDCHYHNLSGGIVALHLARKY